MNYMDLVKGVGTLGICFALSSFHTSLFNGVPPNNHKLPEYYLKLSKKRSKKWMLKKYLGR
jgi:hypothetical protein